ncbi:unnamed protein product [Lactuca virosa]|uniref:Uncharacterized protein n=1 Tax=Lactuca virosa TaxID=75947 RepID=A0AAU9NHR7_9ASTR|nr:unnamed protein product [Lactuca virosa]
MIGNLQLWKERWTSCANPENDFTQKILRLVACDQKRANGTRDHESFGVVDGPKCSIQMFKDKTPKEKFLKTNMQTRIK